MRIAYFDCFSGISGDMTIGAFLDAGLSFEKLSKELSRLKIKGYKLEKARVKRHGIAGTKFDCITDNGAEGRTIKQILSIIGRSSLKDRVKNIAQSIFTNIAEAEARIHGIRSGGQVHLHELGDIDSIVDIVGAGIAIDELGIDSVYASNISMGRSFVKVRHGTLPIPSPASMELLKGVPLEISEIDAELVTPTGAGILKTLAKGFGRVPRMEIKRIGYGAGSRELSERPNMLRVFVGEARQSFMEDRISVIETNIDDMNPQNFEYLFEKLFKGGALDAYTTSIQMKKSRPAYLLTVLAKPEDLNDLSSVVFSETTTTGVRLYEADRFVLERRFTKVKTKYGEVKVKISHGPGGIFTSSPEYDECAKIARNKNVPLKAVYEEAKRLVKA
ncbi:MAG: nickel pincer cofactor biosynthesis protein LarC [Candidatus Omnitrophota bacterium]|nr:nickel pincer cofactor biosynthesis protein LarC [Candidatus Omnitrophota bacterium]